jgi:hypothetical protein
MTVFMKKTKTMISPKRQPAHMAADFAEDYLVTAEQASAALNLPLYYFIDARKRAELGIPYYSINRMVRYRIRELHKWQVRFAAEQVRHADASQTGGAHA